jgi:cell division septum initiation protein DivIVA
MVAALKAVDKENQDLKAKNRELEQRLERLEDMVIPNRAVPASW